MSVEAAKTRYLDMLTTALGDEVMGYLADPTVIEIMLNPDGQLWVETIEQGKLPTRLSMPKERSINVIKLVASFKNEIADAEHPMVASELPLAGARFQGWLPPIVRQPAFAIRKRAIRIFTLQDYLDMGVLPQAGFTILQEAVLNRKNIIIAGGTSSGKTTFANALLSVMKNSDERVLVLEDLPELQVDVADVVHLNTSEVVSMRDLVKGALRMRPDRIIIGEVRDGAALEMLKAWNTGHPGGVCTVHANSAESTLYRLEDLIQEVVVTVPRNLILQAVDLVVYIDRQKNGKRVIREIVALKDFRDGRYQLESLI
jgi:type IV secretion system protein VirB11